MCVGPLKAPRAPAPPAPPPMPAAAPTKMDPEVKAARTQESKRIRAMAGRASTIKTSAQGVLGDADRQMRRLLG